MEFDLDRKIANGLNCPLLSVSSSIRNTVQRLAPWDRIQFVLKMSARSSITDFEKLEALAHWAELKSFRNMILPPVPRYEVRMYREMTQTQEHPPALVPTMVLCLDLDKLVLAHKVRINIRFMIDLLRELDGRAQIVIRQQKLGSDSIDHKETRFPWSKLQLNVCMLLTDILRDDLSRSSRSLLDLWIDGEGQLLYAKCKVELAMEDQWEKIEFNHLDSATKEKFRVEYKHANIADDILRRNVLEFKNDVLPRGMELSTGLSGRFYQWVRSSSLFLNWRSLQINTSGIPEDPVERDSRIQRKELNDFLRINSR